MLRFKALKLAKATTLEIFHPLTVLFQFIFDVTLFKIAFSPVQYGAIGFLGLLYIVRGVKYALVDRKRRKKRRQSGLAFSASVSGYNLSHRKSSSRILKSSGSNEGNMNSQAFTTALGPTTSAEETRQSLIHVAESPQ